jgi:hypothetical protein
MLKVPSNMSYLTQFQDAKGCDNNTSAEKILLKRAKIYPSYRCFPADEFELRWMQRNVTVPVDHKHLIPRHPNEAELGSPSNKKRFRSKLPIDLHRRLDQLKVYLWIFGITNRKPSSNRTRTLIEAGNSSVNGKTAVLPTMKQGMDDGISCGSEDFFKSIKSSIVELDVEMTGLVNNEIFEEYSWLPVELPDVHNLLAEEVEPDGEDYLNDVSSSKDIKQLLLYNGGKLQIYFKMFT